MKIIRQTDKQTNEQKIESVSAELLFPRRLSSGEQRKEWMIMNSIAIKEKCELTKERSVAQGTVHCDFMRDLAHS